MQGTRSISEYVLRFEGIGDALLSRGDSITKQRSNQCYF